MLREEQEGKHDPELEPKLEAEPEGKIEVLDPSAPWDSSGNAPVVPEAKQ